MLPSPEHDFWTSFESCFNAPPGLESTIRQRADTLVAILGARPGLRLLELDCGPAHHALELARRGCAVSGVDARARWLARARHRARRHGLRLELISTDPHRFARSGGGFDAVLHLGGWLGARGSAGDDRLLLATAHHALEPGGRLLVEVYTQERLAQERLAQQRQRRHRLALGSGCHWLETWQIDGRWRHAEIEWTLLEPGREVTGSWSLRLYGRRDLEDLLRDLGFEAIRWPALPWPAERWMAGELVLARRAVGLTPPPAGTSAPSGAR